jgi:hypothetical protein
MRMNRIFAPVGRLGKRSTGFMAGRYHRSLPLQKTAGSGQAWRSLSRVLLRIF